MQIKQFLYFVLAITGVAFNLQSHATPWQNHPASKQIVPASAYDSTGFDSGLWRSEYMNQEEEDSGSPSEKSTAPNETTEVAIKNVPAIFVHSDKLIMIPIETPASVELPGDRIPSEDTVEDDLTMSEWEHAVAKSGVSAIPGATVSGPSLTSAIVGVVGILIVIGAYVSSGKRHC